ncbi:ATP synthase F0 sector subunit b' [Minicystis rosea]|nr:ATP synthase F0 sector subunit b' [Minicystis rosea]
MPLFASAINLALDLSFLAQLVLFGVFITLMKPLLFDPLLKVFEERERRTDGAKKEARVMDEQAGELLKKYEGELAKVRREAGVERDRLRSETARLEAKIMDEARAESAKIVDAGHARIKSEVAQLRKELEAQKPELAREIAARILSREVSS